MEQSSIYDNYWLCSIYDKQFHQKEWRMIKGQDVVLLLKLIAIKDSPQWPQRKLAEHLCMSVSTINASLKRLHESRLLLDLSDRKHVFRPYAAFEFITCSVKYMFLEELGGMTCGVPTGYNTLNHTTLSETDHITVWPHAEGTHRGIASTPLYPSVPSSILKYPDPIFYELLCLTDTLRSKTSRVRDKDKAKDILHNLILGLNDSKQIA